MLFCAQIAYCLTIWLVKKDFPLPEGPRINLLRLVMTPRFIGKSEISRGIGLPVKRSTIRIPNEGTEKVLGYSVII